jgi:hypothetical protein
MGRYEAARFMGGLTQAVLLIGLTLLMSEPATADEPDLTCEMGPITKTFGQTQWKVYSCNEERHLMLVPAPGNPAGEVIFMLFWENGRWQVLDMGSHTRAADAAHSEIQLLSEADIMGLIAETKVH